MSLREKRGDIFLPFLLSFFLGGSLYLVRRVKNRPSNDLARQTNLLLDRREKPVDTDFKLIRKMRQGDDGAFDVFVHKYYGEILKYCGYHCMDVSYAEDLTQETFVRFFTNLSDYHYMGKTKNYLYTIAGNLCRDFYRKRRDMPANEEFLENSGSFQDVSLEAAESRADLDRAMIKLPEELREMIILYYFQEMKQTEIARILGIGLPLVKYRLRKAKESLSQILREEETR